MAEITPLQKLALSLRGQAPQEWDAFLAEFSGRAMKANADMVRCPTDMLMRAQGMAIAVTELYEELRDAPKANEKRQPADKRLRGSTWPTNP